MKKAAVVLVALVIVMLVVPAAFAQDNAPAGSKLPLNPTTLARAAAFAVAISPLGCGLRQGRIAPAACEGSARNPGAADGVRGAMILGLVFVETLTLFTFALGFLLYRLLLFLRFTQ